MVGSSFLTDGVQVKVVLTTLESTRGAFSGSSALDDAGYSKLPRANATVQDLVRRGKGVYNISSVIPSTELPSDLHISSADPGQAKVINVSRSVRDLGPKGRMPDVANV